MRAPHRRRPRKRTIWVPPAIDLDDLAGRVVYVGSPEHKAAPSFAGPPRLRADASRCPPEITELEVVSSWLRDAIRLGAVGAPWEGGLPRYVWYKTRDKVFEGRLVNRGAGHYKGYPLGRNEWPTGIEEIYGA